MAHANIFQKLSKAVQQKQPKGNSMDQTSMETIQVLGEQVLQLREIIEEQHLVIEDLAQTISGMKTEQKETDQNLKLAFIDQKDLAKQLRILKSNLEANEYTSQKRKTAIKEKAVAQRIQQTPIQDTVQDDKEIEELFFSNAKNSPVMKNAEASNAIKQTLEELKKLEKPKQRFLAKKQAEAMQHRQAKTVATKAMREQGLQQQLAQKSERRLANEELAKRMIFGKTSKLLGQ